MLQIIIFSFNRAAQLNILLNSLFTFWKNPKVNINVLYNSSNDLYERGYSILKSKSAENGWSVVFRKENKWFNGYTIRERLNLRNIYRMLRYPYIRKPKSDFREQLLNLLKDEESELVMFLTDDAQFVSPVDVSEDQLQWILSAPYNRQFSLRMGHGMDKEPVSIIRSLGGGIFGMGFLTSRR